MASSLQPSTAYAAALNGSIAYVDKNTRSGDGPITYGTQYITTDGIDILIHGENGGGNNLTWGVFGSALQGLDTWMAGAGNGYSDATFQINDGENEVGNGFIGGDNQKGECVFANAYIKNTLCIPVDISGSIYGPRNMC